MKTKMLVSLLLCLGLMAGCSKKTSTESSAAPADAATVQNGVKTFALTAGDTMKYSLTRLEVSPGEQVKVTLENVGTLPITAMGHNWILLKAGTDAQAFVTTAQADKASGYFPDNLQGDVIAHIPLQGPKDTGSVTFTAPTTPGEYVYLCTFPAHYISGMHGVLVVK